MTGVVPQTNWWHRFSELSLFLPNHIKVLGIHQISLRKKNKNGVTCIMHSFSFHVFKYEVKLHNNIDIQSFDVEYGIYFTCETGFYHSNKREVRVKIYWLTGDINSLSNAKTLNFLFSTFSLLLNTLLSNHCMLYTCLVIFTIWKWQFYGSG